MVPLNVILLIAIQQKQLALKNNVFKDTQEYNSDNIRVCQSHWMMNLPNNFTQKNISLF